MEYKIHRFVYKEANPTNGIISYIHAKNSSQLNVSVSSARKGNAEIIFDGKNHDWESNPIPNQWFSIKFNNFLVKVDFLSMFGCSSGNCPMGFDVYALNSKGERELICKLNETDKKNVIGKTIELNCSSTTFYSDFLLQQTKLNTDNNHIFGFYYFEFFGDLYNKNTPKNHICSNNAANYEFKFSWFYSVFILIYNDNS